MTPEGEANFWELGAMAKVQQKKENKVKIRD